MVRSPEEARRRKPQEYPIATKGVRSKEARAERGYDIDAEYRNLRRGIDCEWFFGKRKSCLTQHYARRIERPVSG